MYIKKKKKKNKILKGKNYSKKDSSYHKKFLYNNMSVLVKKLFYKTSVLYTIKNYLTFTTEHGHNRCSTSI